MQGMDIHLNFILSCIKIKDGSDDPSFFSAPGMGINYRVEVPNAL